MKTTVFALFSILFVLALSSSAFAARDSRSTRSNSVTLRSLAITGPSSVNESSTATFTATATWSNGSVTTITPTWRENSSYARISTSGVLTTSAVSVNQAVTVTASYSSGGVSKTASKTVTIVNAATSAPAPTLSSLTISGPNSVNESSKATYAATATWSNGSVTAITPTWSVNSAYVTISSSGALTTSTVNSNLTVTVTARYTSGGITRTATKSVSIVDVPPAPTDPILPAEITLRWDPSADPQVIGYRLYYKESYADDPSFKSLPFDSTSLYEGDSPLDVGKKVTATLNLPYDTTVFCFAVTGYNSAGLESDYSNIVCTTN